MTALDITVRYAESDSAELAGTAEALTALSAALRSGASATIAITVPTAPPEPYDVWLHSIEVSPRTVPHMTIRVVGRELIATGGRSSLGLLADNIEAFTASRGQSHIHIEYYPGHYYLQEGSVPLNIVAH